MAFFAFGWMAFSFWPLYMGRFSTQCVLLVFWECLTFLALAHYLAAPRGSTPNKNLYGLAILTGTGFYTYLAWPFVAVMTSLTVFFNRYKTTAFRLKTTLQFLGVTILCIVPLAVELVRRYHGYFWHLWAFGSPHPLADRFSLPVACFTDFFWGTPYHSFHFGPIWGGFLNPVLTSLFFLAAVHLLRSWRTPRSLWILTAFAVFFLPTILTNNFEIMRLSPMLPLLTFICAIGTQVFLSHFPAKKRVFVFAVILTASCMFDAYHLFFVYPSDWEKNIPNYEGHKSPEFHKAYSLLKPMADREGPGLLLLNFNPDPYDQTLFVATYSFNAAENLRLDPAQAKWAAILTNIHEEPYFKKKFPEGKWFWLSEGLKRHDGGFILEVIPLDLANKPLLSRWTAADLSLKELTNLVVELGVDPDQSQMMAVLDKSYPAFKGDPFLESRYWRIKAFHHAAEGKIAEAVQAEKQAIVKGLPMAHLYNDMGCLLYKERRVVKARKAFEDALKLKLNLTDAETNLQNLLLSQQTTK